jgi:hypothetical protein
MIGAYLFGGITILQLHAQAIGLGIPSQLMSSLPYLANHRRAGRDLVDARPGRQLGAGLARTCIRPDR